jgi:hypothetical protein
MRQSVSAPLGSLGAEGKFSLLAFGAGHVCKDQPVARRSPYGAALRCWAKPKESLWGQACRLTVKVMVTSQVPIGFSATRRTGCGQI